MNLETGSAFRSRTAEVLLIAFAFVVLLLYGFYSLSYLRLNSITFELDNRSWEIVSVTPPCDGEDCLEVGDRVLSINGVAHDEYVSSYVTTPIDWSGPLQMDLVREGEPRRVTVIRGEMPTTFWVAIGAILLFPGVFWAAGTLTVIFVRPRDERWLVLVLFNYTTALWFAAGFVSQSKLGFSSVILHVLLWFFAPITVHLHLALPNLAFPRLHRYLLPALYTAAGIACALDLSHQIDSQLFLLSMPVGIFLSLAIIIRRQFLDSSPATRVGHRLMLFGILLGAVPLLSLVVMFSWDPLQDLPFDLNRLAVTLGGLLAIANWPIAYLFAIYKNDLGSIQIRPNRLFGIYSFLSMYVIAFVAVMLTQLKLLETHPIILSLVVSLIFVSLAPTVQRRYLRFVDRAIFHTRYQSEQVLSAFAARLPSAFDRLRLRRLLVGDILPTLMIRESTLELVDRGEVVQVYRQGLPPGPTARRLEDLEPLLARSDQYIPAGTFDDPRFAWVRLAIPLTIQDEPIGVWLLGRRDPDDFYPSSDIALVRNLANQIATVARAQLEIVENKHLQQQLLHAQKMEAIGRLSAGISHDFNNLLSAIVGYGNLLLERHGEDARSRRYLTGILEAGHKAESLTKHLLSFSRRDNTDAQIVDISKLIRDMAGLLRRLLSDDIELVLDAVARGRVLLDPNRLEQAILNLAVNAGDAMPNGGRLTIETADILFDGNDPAPHPDLETGSYLRLRVRDTGTGIDPQIEPHIFEPFFTTKEMGKGTGLGLATTYGIVRQAGGQILADSLSGRGTTFHLYLPVVTATPAKPGYLAAAPALVPPAPPGHATILVAEDDEMVRTVVCEILRSHEYHVIEATDGQQALSLSQAHDGRIDLLLSDVMMPHMKGPELARRLLSSRPGVRVLYMSGYNDATAFREVPQRSAHPMLQKPFPPDVLIRRVAELLDGQDRKESAS